MKILISFTSLVVLSLSITLAKAEAEAAPSVVTSIRPVHALAAAVMDGVSSPHLIVQGAGSPHSYALRPSDAKALQDAVLVFWIGPELETFLEPPLAALASGARIVTLADTPSLTRFAMREETRRDMGEAGEHEEHADHEEHEEHEEEEHHDDHGHGEFDPHLWLDPENAIAMAREIASTLAQTDPGNAARYQANADALATDISTLTDEIRQILRPVKNRPYITFHDAYQYFEKRFGLTTAGFITLNPEVSPGARRIREIQHTIDDLGGTCLFAEPQFESRLLEAISEGSDVKYGTLDPLGSEFEPGPGLYHAMLRALAHALKDCLTPLS